MKNVICPSLLWIIGSGTVTYSLTPLLLKPTMYCTICPWLVLSGIGVHVRFTLKEEVGIAWKSVTIGGTVWKKKEEEEFSEIPESFQSTE